MSGRKVTSASGATRTVPGTEAWVSSHSVQTERLSTEKKKRLTIDIPASPHKTIKSACALMGTEIRDEVRVLLYNKYGKE